MNTLLTALRDQIAENLYPEQITSFIEEFDAACVGKNTSDVWRQFAIWMLVDPEHGVIKFTKPGTDAHDVIQRVAQLYVDNCKDIDLWREAARCARSALYAHADQGANYNTTTYNATTAAEYATYAAYEYDYFADKYAASAAEEAASAYYSAWSNNWTKYDYENDDEDEYEIMADLANNETANDDAFYETMADKLIELIKEAPEAAVVGDDGIATITYKISENKLIELIKASSHEEPTVLRETQESFGLELTILS